jgi:hypothetical protein
VTINDFTANEEGAIPARMDALDSFLKQQDSQHENTPPSGARQRAASSAN